MSYTPNYTRKNFVNGQAPSINANNMNAIEDTLVNLEQFAQNADEAILNNAEAILAEATARTAAIEAEATAREEAITAEQTAREQSEALLKNTLQKVANSNIQTSNDPLDWAMDGNIVSAMFEGYAYKSKNLLDTTLQTTTKDGITCTRNDDGTYTLNGTASKYVFFELARISGLSMSNTYKLLGCSPNGSALTYRLVAYRSNSYSDAIDYGNGANFKPTNASDYYAIDVEIQANTTCNNVVFKPMVTEDLSATYNDYEPFGIIKPSGVVESFGKNLAGRNKIVGNYYVNNANYNYGISANSGAELYRIDVVEGKTYTLRWDGNGAIRFEDGNENLVSGIAYRSMVDGTTFTVPSGAKVVAFSPYINAEVQLEISSVATAYEPYKGNSSITLPYIPLGVNNIHDELIVNADGSGRFVKKVNSANLDDLTWTWGWSKAWFSDDLTDALAPIQSEKANAISEKYSTVDGNTVVNTSTTGIMALWMSSGTFKRLAINNGSSTDKPSGIIYYQLATPIETPLTSSEVEQILSLKTFADTTYIDADGMAYTIGYAQNSAKAIKELQNIIQNMLNAIGGSDE